MTKPETLIEGVRILTDETDPVRVPLLDLSDRTLKRQSVKISNSWKWILIWHEGVKWLVTNNVVPKQWFGLPLASWEQPGAHHFDKIRIIWPKKKKSAVSPRKK